MIIAVNLTLAFKAVTTFPGLEVKNSYVASQNFDADRAAQQALGWQVAARIEAGAADPDDRRQGRTGRDCDDRGDAGPRHPCGRDDRTPDFTFDGVGMGRAGGAGAGQLEPAAGGDGRRWHALPAADS